MLMKLSLMPTWTCSGPTGCHWCHQVPPGDCSCTHKLESWSHHLAENVEDPANDAEDPRDGLEALVDVGEAHEVLESLMKTMMPLQRSWSPLIWWHDGTLMKSLMLKILMPAHDPLVSFVEKVMEPLHVLWGDDLIWSLACGGCPWLEVEALVLIESMDCWKEPLKMPWWRNLENALKKSAPKSN